MLQNISCKAWLNLNCFLKSCILNQRKWSLWYFFIIWQIFKMFLFSVLRCYWRTRRKIWTHSSNTKHKKHLFRNVFTSKRPSLLLSKSSAYISYLNPPPFEIHLTVFYKYIKIKIKSKLKIYREREDNSIISGLGFYV